MCRWIVYFGQNRFIADVLLRPEHGLIQLSDDTPCYCPGIENSKVYDKAKASQRNHQLNADGFGVGFYQSETPAPGVYKSVRPAWNDQNLRSLSSAITSKIMFAHARAATDILSVGQLNCHPFSVGKFMFMHNGSICGFNLVKRQIISALDDRILSLVHGSCDSEYAFMLFLNYMYEKKGSLDFSGMEVTGNDLKNVLVNTIRNIVRLCDEAGVTQASSLNFAVTDGSSVVATRFRNSESEDPPTLYITHGHSFGGNHDEKVGDPHINRPLPGTEAETNLFEMAVISSEPLSYVNSSRWHLIPKDQIILIENVAESDEKPVLRVTETPLIFFDKTRRMPSVVDFEPLSLKDRHSEPFSDTSTLERTLSEIFDILDTDKDGVLSVEKLFHVMRQIQPMLDMTWQESEIIEKLDLEQEENVSKTKWMDFFMAIARNFRYSLADMVKLTEFAKKSSTIPGRPVIRRLSSLHF
eukprot:840219_1